MFTPGKGNLLALSLTVMLSGVARSDDELKQRATWAPPAPVEVKLQLDAWLSGKISDDSVQQQIAALWPMDGTLSAGPETLDRLIATVAIVDEGAREVVNFCRQDSLGTDPPQVPDAQRY